MMPKSTACPEAAQFQLLAAGQLADAQRDALLEHLQGCETCLQKLGQLSEQHTLVGMIRQAQGLDDQAARATTARLLERLRQLGPRPAPTGADMTLPPREQAGAGRLSFACPSCGKSLKARSELAGKKSRCPHCGESVCVPAHPADAPAAPRTRSPETRSQADAQTQIGAVAAPTTGDPLAPQAASAPDREQYDFLAPSQAADELGRLGPYRVLEVLGAGGMGIVFRAEDPQLARLVALKAMLPALAASDSAKKRFLREGRSAAAIKHDHIVTIYQVGEDRGIPYLAMEFLEGEPLDRRLQRQGKVPLAEVLRIGREVALGLAAAHKRELIHRDIKPANIWLEAESGRAKILDFGLARAAGEEGQLTQQGAIVGTPAYMAPEQAQGKGVDARCDLFSLGCVLYRLATGVPAFKGSDMISTLMAVATETPRPPQELEPNVPPSLSRLILNLLAKAPADRPPSAVAVAESLERIAQKGESRPATASLPARSPARPLAALAGRRRWGVVAAAALALALLIPLGLWLSGVLRIRTPDGVLVVTVNEPDAEVYVDGSKVTVTWGEGGKKAEVHARPGTRRVEVKKDGFAAYGEEVTLADGGRQVIAARLEKPPPPPADKPKEVPAKPPPDGPRRAAEWALGLGGTVGVRVAGQEQEVRPGGNLPAGDVELVRVNLSSKAVNDADLAHLEGLGSLRVLSLEGTGVSNSGMRRLKGLTGLAELNLARTHVGDGGLAHLAGLTNLRRLLFWGNPQLTDAGLAHLAGMTNLTAVHLFGDHRVTNDGLAHLKGLVGLEELDLNATQVTDAGLVHIKGMTNLKFLNLMSTLVTGGGLVYIKDLTNISVLWLGNSKVIDAGLVHLKGLTKLRLLGLDHTGVTDAGLVHLAGLTNLALLGLAALKVSDAGLVHLKGLTNLEHLVLDDNKGVTDAGLAHLAGLTRLVRLDLKATNVSDEGLPALYGLSRLREVYLTGTGVTAAGIAALHKALPGCRVTSQ
jgi:hypothetical protein